MLKANEWVDKDGRWITKPRTIGDFIRFVREATKSWRRPGEDTRGLKWRIGLHGEIRGGWDNEPCLACPIQVVMHSVAPARRPARKFGLSLDDTHTIIWAADDPEMKTAKRVAREKRRRWDENDPETKRWKREILRVRKQLEAAIQPALVA